MNGRAMLVRPMINEKSMALVKNGFYTFQIDRSITKEQIKKVVSTKFKVEVVSVKTISTPAKRKMQRTRKGFYSVAGTKKAIVQVKKGQKIALFETLTAPEEEEVAIRTAEGEVVGTTKEKKSLLGRTKVKIEKNAKTDDQEKAEKAADSKRPTKESQKEDKKGAK